MSRIRERRKQRGLSQERLAEALGVTQSAVSYYERGESDLSSPTLVNLARALECSTDYLLELTDDPTPHHIPAGLTETEQSIVSALRSGDKLKAIRLIVRE